MPQAKGNHSYLGDTQEISKCQISIYTYTQSIQVRLNTKVKCMHFTSRQNSRNCNTYLIYKKQNGVFMK